MVERRIRIPPVIALDLQRSLWADFAIVSSFTEVSKREPRDYDRGILKRRMEMKYELGQKMEC
jgi:hypothetical protein